MKVLFLDFDGVLNCTMTFVRRAQKIKAQGMPPAQEDWKLTQLDEDLIVQLNPIVEQTQCNIVISSSWRIGYDLPTLAEYLSKKGFKYPEKVIGVTPVMPLVEHSRGVEIKTWLSKHPKVTSYAILDDDIEDILPIHPINTVRTDPKEGLTSEKVEDVVMVLSR
jgi:hypothetical protein